jgi:hypothetical protein
MSICLLPLRPSAWVIARIFGRGAQGGFWVSIRVVHNFPMSHGTPVCEWQKGAQCMATGMHTRVCVCVCVFTCCTGDKRIAATITTGHSYDLLKLALNHTLIIQAKKRRLAWFRVWIVSCTIWVLTFWASVNEIKERWYYFTRCVDHENVLVLKAVRNLNVVCTCETDLSGVGRKGRVKWHASDIWSAGKGPETVEILSGH